MAVVKEKAEIIRTEDLEERVKKYSFSPPTQQVMRMLLFNCAYYGQQVRMGMDARKEKEAEYYSIMAQRYIRRFLKVINIHHTLIDIATQIARFGYQEGYRAQRDDIYRSLQLRKIEDAIQNIPRQ